MKNLKRAERRRQMKRFAIGDWVVWGIAVAAHQVVEVNERGVVVDVSGEKHVEYLARKQADGRYFLTVLFDHNTQCHTIRCRFHEPGIVNGPPVKVDIEEWRAHCADYKLRYHSPW